MQEHTAALDMAQKFVAETDAVARALDKSGDIRDDKRLALAHGDNAEDGSYGCEMIIRNYGLRLADDRDKR